MSMTFTLHDDVQQDKTLTLTGGNQFRLESLDRHTPLEQIIDAIRINGGVRIKGFLASNQLEEAEKAVRPHLDRASYARADDQTKRLARLPEIAPGLTETILTDELYLGIMNRFLSTEHKAWVGNKLFTTTEQPIVAMSSVFEVGPGMHAQDLHRDDSIWYNRQPQILHPDEYRFGRDVSISFFIAGTKTTKSNGATRWIPGSHLTESSTQPDSREAIDAELDAGDAFFMLSSCYHGAGQNSTTDEKRLVYALFMQQPHLRQEEAFHLYLSHDQVRGYPKEVQRRLGYDVAVPNLGWVDHASPLESVLGQKGADKRVLPGYNPVEGTTEGRKDAHESRV